MDDTHSDDPQGHWERLLRTLYTRLRAHLPPETAWTIAYHFRQDLSDRGWTPPRSPLPTWKELQLNRRGPLPIPPRPPDEDDPQQ
ncbi:hypothetical protein [Bailinhaonella thermotolerans]|uniref:Uncharacterized protein n=1 Tax=Bailinhaonella thermotolerans TaxID=1070861 RepID=A0A3A4A654_9ACTN|nr:hypothetical protein [Bailinhaonella thermotolerans]RJL21087.1 hypothetical protein D5H75_38390 [Bailinhaonella thermotolerans]